MIDTNSELAKKLREDLENWGDYYRDRWRDELGYTIQPMFKMYRAPRQDATPIRSCPDVARAERTNEAVIAIGVSEPHEDRRKSEPFTLFNFIVAKWAKGKSQTALAHQFHCTKRTIRNRTNQAIDVYYEQLMIINKNK